MSESDFQPRFSLRISLLYLQNPPSNILKIPRNSVSAYQNEIWITYRRLFAQKFIIYFGQVEACFQMIT